MLYLVSVVVIKRRVGTQLRAVIFVTPKLTFKSPIIRTPQKMNRVLSALT